MNTLVKNITLSKNRLKLYKFSREDLSVKKEKDIRSVKIGMKVTEKDDNFLKKLSDLNNDSKYIPARMAYYAMSIGIEVLKKNIKEEKLNIDDVKLDNILDKKNLFKTNQQLNSLLTISQLLEEKGLEINVTKKDESK